MLKVVNNTTFNIYKFYTHKGDDIPLKKKYVKVWNADNKFNEKMGISLTPNIFYTETTVTFSWIQFCRQVV